MSGSVPATDRTQLVRQLSSRTPTHLLDAKSRENNYMNGKKMKSRLFPWSGCNMGWQGQTQKASRAHDPGPSKSKVQGQPWSNIAKKGWSQRVIRDYLQQLLNRPSLAPAPPGECCPRSRTRPEWQCDSPWSKVARWDGRDSVRVNLKARSTDSLHTSLTEARTA